MLPPGTLSKGSRQEYTDKLTFVVPRTHEVSGFQGEQLQPSFQLPWISLGNTSEARYVYEMDGAHLGGTL
jgi:hypothetical protein